MTRPRVDRDLHLLFLANVLFALGLGLYFQLFNVYALSLGASRFTIGVMSAVMLATTAIGYIPGAWAADHVRLKPVIVGVWWLTVPTAVSFALAPSWPWLFPGLVLSGLYMMNNPAFKAYIMLKSEPERVGRNVSYVFGSYPLGLAVAPLAGGYVADHYGMRLVFVISIFVYIASSTTVTLIHDTAFHAAGSRWRLDDLIDNRVFRRYLGFFLIGFLAVYVAQPFLLPYLAQVHHQGYTALGIYASIWALGGSAITFVAGQATDRFGPRAGIGSVLVCLLLGAVLLLTGWAPPLWALAVFLYGAFDAFRFTATGIVGRSFDRVPLTWGFAVFDATMGIPMVAGSILGGALYRRAFDLPFLVVIALAAALLLGLLLFSGRRGNAGRRRVGPQAR